jgi:hypothetical protein
MEEFLYRISFAICPDKKERKNPLGSFYPDHCITENKG